MTTSFDPAQARPFLKWAGGKGQLLKQYTAFFPQDAIQNYYEPFVGSGAVFFYLRGSSQFETYHLSDVNPALINCYRVVRDEVESLIALLAEHKALHGKDHYYAVRALDRDPGWLQSAPEVERAARMIYLNKTCYNGLWRVNRQGQFNVPMGRYANPDILSEHRLRAASAALQGVAIEAARFASVLDRAAKGDFVYFDPPYHPVSVTADFTSYAADDFGEADQRALAQVFAALARRGVRVMLSNSDTPPIHALYADFRIEIVEARRAINSAKGKRGPVTEVVVMNY
jgi:DNA adenine methylase